MAGSLERALLLAQAASTWAMVGVIWTVQLAQYPLFQEVGATSFRAFHAGHSRGISLVVVPLMLLELATAAALVLRRPAAVAAPEAALGLALATAVWAVTAAVQVPLHATLGRGLDVLACRELVRGNWLRTALWSARGALVLRWLGRGLAP